MDHNLQAYGESHRIESNLRALRASEELSPFKKFKLDLRQIQGKNWCDCGTCPQCVGRKQTMIDNMIDELLTELEEE
jgi:hypothetical protein